MTLRKKPFENNVEKGENTINLCCVHSHKVLYHIKDNLDQFSPIKIVIIRRMQFGLVYIFLVW